MRVAIATETFSPSVDGVAVRLERTVDWLVAHGHEVIVAAPDLGVDRYLTPDGTGVEVAGMPTAVYPFYRSRAWARPSARLGRLLDSWGPDVVHAAQPDLLAAQAVRWAARRRVPLVTSYHTDVLAYLPHYLPAPLVGPASRAVARYERALHDRAPVTLVTSEAMRDRLAALGHAGLRVIPRGVDLSARSPRFYDEGMRARLAGGDPDRPLLVFVGRLAPEKSLESLLTVLRARPDVALALVGDGPARDGLESLFAGTRTVFTGFLSGMELSRAFASGDAFVFPSTTETLGLVVAEAQASGVPVVAASSPATRCQVRDGVDGLVYDPCASDGPGSLLGCLDRVLGDAALRQRLAAAGVEATRGAGWEASGEATYRAYADAVALFEAGWRP